MSTSILSTRERYSPIARASEKAEAARKAYNEAGTRYLADPTLQNSNALASARKALTEAEKLQAQVATIWKHTEGKKRPGMKAEEGSDNTSTGSRRDAGFSDMGPF